MTAPKSKVYRRRESDSVRSVLCWFAARASEFWDFIDKRQIDKHLVSLGVFIGTVIVTRWAMGYAGSHADKSGIEVAAIIAAVNVPYMALQTAAISFYFRARE
tara:strand:- start:45661 stop:45969 length:309 start_codon:yes stop_codon:yes gene_type:complete